MTRAIRAVDPATPRRIVGHVTSDTFLTIGDDEVTTGTKVEGGVLATEGVNYWPVMILVIFTGCAEFISDTLIAVTFAVLVSVYKAR